jgi:phosphoribosyl 1,2-cyclic phosphodiesterase
MYVRFWGVHGSLPRPGPSTLKYGGNTACVEIRCGDVIIILDAGSGIRELGEHLVSKNPARRNAAKSIKAHIFFSHVHWDHVQGFPFFHPAFVPGNEIHLYGWSNVDRTIHSIMNDQMASPNFPVDLSELPATLHFHDIAPGRRLVLPDDVVVVTEALNHPQGSLGYSVSRRGKTVVYATDTEADDDHDHRVIDLARGADLLIHDAMFTREQYEGTSDGLSRREWGHSTWEGAVRIAEAADVRQLILFHHGNDDATVAAIEAKARERFPASSSAYEGMELTI